MKLEVLSKEDCEKIRKWRNEQMIHLRTPFLLTKEMQEDFYRDVVCNWNAPHRYWGIYESDVGLIGIGGITNIQWENSIGEITLVLDPKQTGKGLGEAAVDLVLDQAFNRLNLKTVCGECYICNPAKNFWDKIRVKYKGYAAILPRRKYWNGQISDSIYFSIDRDDFNNSNKQR